MSQNGDFTNAMTIDRKNSHRLLKMFNESLTKFSPFIKTFSQAFV